MGEARKAIRIAAVADVHAHEEAVGQIRASFAGLNERADVLILAGDLTLSGLVQEVRVLVSELSDVVIPKLAVLGNHDWEASQQLRILEVLEEGGIRIVDGRSSVLNVAGSRVGFAGAKGFCGGFDRYLVTPFGEEALKEFVRAGRRETEKLESALAALDSDFRVVAVHYSPIRDTLVGEALELYPYLGSSSLSLPIDTLGADVVVHGHAHYGSRFGRTKTGIPVYNVAKPIVNTYALIVLSDEEASASYDAQPL